jgi:hypothetical protein
MEDAKMNSQNSYGVMNSEQSQNNQEMYSSYAAKSSQVAILDTRSNSVHVLSGVGGTQSHVEKTSRSATTLELGANKNYKTTVIQSRWEKERAKWLDASNHPPGDPQDGIAE